MITIRRKAESHRLPPPRGVGWTVQAIDLADERQHEDCIMADSKAQTRKARIQARARKQELTMERKWALTAGGCGTFVLLLSLSHCTYALHTLTGMWGLFAFLMAVGIDVGMVVCECIVVVGRRDEARAYAEWYVRCAIVLSVVLNAYASASHADHWFIAAIVGGCIPGFVYLLAKTAAYCWKEV